MKNINYIAYKMRDIELINEEVSELFKEIEMDIACQEAGLCSEFLNDMGDNGMVSAEQTKFLEDTKYLPRLRAFTKYGSK